MNEAKKIALFGGTFDPIHAGHLFIAQSAREQCGLDQVIFLPCGHSPHKFSPTAATAEQRGEMIRLATSACPWIAVDDYDVVGPQPPFSYLTAGHFVELYPMAQLYLIMGSDQWEALPGWKHPEILAQHVTFLVFARNSQPKEREGYRMIALRGTHPASATALRDRNSPNYLNADWLAEDVWQYIKTNRLYV